MGQWVCALASLGLLLGAVGCGGQSPSTGSGDGGDMMPDPMDDLDDDNNDDDPPDPEEVCQDAQTRELPCGVEGTQRQVCLDNVWVDAGSCQEPPECESGQTQMVPCGDDGEGIQTQLCLDGAWTDEGPCVVLEACEQDGQVRETRCGADDIGLLIEECQGGFWTAQRACEATFATLGADANNTCGATEDGTTYCWGERRGPIPSEVTQLDGVVALDGGSDFMCALTDVGEVWCWGSNGLGQLGDGTTEERQAPALVDGLSGVTSIALGDVHACAIVGNAEVWCWGSNAQGELGFESEEVSSLVARPMPGVDDAVGLSLGRRHTCILHADRTVSCVGSNGNDQFGVDSPNRSAQLVAMPGVDDAVQIAALAQATCVLRQSGAVHCVGADEIQAPNLEGVTKIVGGFFAVCALLDNQEVWCWGSNRNRVLGDGTTHTPDPGEAVRVLDLDDATDLFAGRNHLCAVRSGGRVSCWGARGNHGKLGAGLQDNVLPSPVQAFGVEDAVDLALGLNFSCVLGGDGQVGCWGENEQGELGLEGRSSLAQRAETVDLRDVSEVDAGNKHVCARLSDGRVACWGSNFSGQLGTAPIDGDDASPSPRFVDGIDDAVSLAVGSNHTCVLRQGGAVWCWGFGAQGQLGGGVEVDSGAPAQVVGLDDAVDVAAGFNHTCALKADGTVACWGASNVLGVDSPDVAVPVAVEMLQDVVLLKASRHHTCAMRQGGSVLCWGSRISSQARGQGERNTDSGPLVVPDFSGAVDLTLGESHTCAVIDSGAVVCWGRNGSGQLGLALEIEGRSPPQESVPGLEGIVSVEAGWYHTCGINTEGQVWCWGDNNANQLGGQIKRSYVLAP